MKKDSWLNSDSFLKRAFAIWGYHFVANLIIVVPVMLLWTIFAAIFFAALAPTIMQNPGMMEVSP